MAKNPFCVILSTFPNRKSAETAAKGLIRKRFAACCNLLPNVTSFFRWAGKEERAKEFLLFIKTEFRKREKVRTFLKQHHPYTLPEIIILPIADGDPAYLAWIRKEVR